MYVSRVALSILSYCGRSARDGQLLGPASKNGIFHYFHRPLLEQPTTQSAPVSILSYDPVFGLIISLQ